MQTLYRRQNSLLMMTGVLPGLALEEARARSWAQSPDIGPKVLSSDKCQPMLSRACQGSMACAGFGMG